MTYGIMGVAILLIDLSTGKYLLFPILFVAPVSLCAWHSSLRWAYALALLLPSGRFLIAEFVDQTAPDLYGAANAVIRMAVLLLLAYFSGRTARLTKELRERVAGLVTMCAWSRTIEYEGKWISFEEYLKRRFDLDTSHSISPAEAEKVLADLDARYPDDGSERPDIPVDGAE